MHHHALLTASLPSLTLASVFQAAAGRAWARTRPTRAYYRTNVRTEGLATNAVRSAIGGHSVGVAKGGSATSIEPTSCTASPSLPELRLHGASSFPPPTAISTASSSDNMSEDAADNRADVGPRSTLTRSRRQCIVTFIDVESLSSHDMSSSNFGPSGCASYESDPPWEEIRASLPDALLPRVVPFHVLEAKRAPLFPHPVSMDSLVQNLVHAITATPPAHLSQVLSYHAAHPRFHSTFSFNLLIKYAIRNASFGTVGHLLSRMVREDMPGDRETRVLRVRAMVRSGLWSRAWQEEMEQVRETGEGMPLPVWLEFFGSVKRGAIQDPHDRGQGGRAESLQTPAPSVTAERFHALMKHPPATSATEWEHPPVRVIYSLVRSLVAQDRRTAAIDVTRTYFQSLPAELDGEWRRACLSIIHLHLTPGRARNLSEHFTGLNTLFAFLGMHHSFQPTSTTLFFLLRSLMSTKRCGERADRLVHSFERRWGPDVVDDRVRRRWAALWLKQRSLNRAAAILGVQAALDEQRVEWRAELDANGDGSGKDRARRLRWLDLYRPPAKNKERWRWRVLRRRFVREQVRRSGR